MAALHTTRSPTSPSGCRPPAAPRLRKRLVPSAASISRLVAAAGAPDAEERQDADRSARAFQREQQLAIRPHGLMRLALEQLSAEVPLGQQGGAARPDVPRQ